MDGDETSAAGNVEDAGDQLVQVDIEGARLSGRGHHADRAWQAHPVERKEADIHEGPRLCPRCQLFVVMRGAPIFTTVRHSPARGARGAAPSMTVLLQPAADLGFHLR
jgi:hypothetical protein